MVTHDESTITEDTQSASNSLLPERIDGYLPIALERTTAVPISTVHHRAFPDSCRRPLAASPRGSRYG